MQMCSLETSQNFVLYVVTFCNISPLVTPLGTVLQ